MRFAALILVLVCASPARADLSKYANRDSLFYDGLVFIAGTDLVEYAYRDSIRLIFLVENPTGTERYFFPITFCEGAGLSELWCSVPGAADEECVRAVRDDRICETPEPVRPRVVGIMPGQRVLYEAVVPPFHDLVIPQGWSFRRGNVVFSCPWQPPYWGLAVPYERRGPTQAAAVSWSAIKALYR